MQRNNRANIPEDTSGFVNQQGEIIPPAHSPPAFSPAGKEAGKETSGHIIRRIRLFSSLQTLEDGFLGISMVIVTFSWNLSPALAGPSAGWRRENLLIW
jgi:hypothetical protein